jgi:hypothetical protein
LGDPRIQKRTGVLILSDGLECMADAWHMGTAKSVLPYKEQNEPGARLFCAKMLWLRPLAYAFTPLTTCVSIARRRMNVE